MWQLELYFSAEMVALWCLILVQWNCCVSICSGFTDLDRAEINTVYYKGRPAVIYITSAHIQGGGRKQIQFPEVDFVVDVKVKVI